MLAFLDLHPHSYWFSTTKFLEPSPKKSNTVHLGVGFKFQIFFIFTPNLRKIPILTNIFQFGLKPPTSPAYEPVSIGPELKKKDH